MNKHLTYGLMGYDGRLGAEVKTLFDENSYEPVVLGNDKGINEESFPDIIIDCSLPDGLDTTISLARKYSVPLVSAVTGYNESQFNKLKELSRQTAVLYSGNFSVGVQMLLKLVEEAEKNLQGWDVEIVETHHRFKKDKPSGTAKMILDKFGNRNVNVSSLRLGGVVGEHAVHFGGRGESLSITHSAISRRTFAEGISKAVNFLVDKKPGYYSFKEAVFNNNGE